MVRRSDALFHIEHAEFVDKLFVEFGRVDVLAEPDANDTKIEFNDTQRSKIVVMIQVGRDLANRRLLSFRIFRPFSSRPSSPPSRSFST